MTPTLSSIMNSTPLQQAISLAQWINMPEPTILVSSEEEMKAVSERLRPEKPSPKRAAAPCLRPAEIQRTLSIRTQQSEIDQALEIAIHYLRCQTLAMDLKDAWSLRHSAKNAGYSTTELDEAIKYLADQIKAIHAGDLGIKLEWPAQSPDRGEWDDLGEDPEKN